jgi:hypothetical protein
LSTSITFYLFRRGRQKKKERGKNEKNEKRKGKKDSTLAS